MKNRVVVVTGAASGIGRATALRCAERGAALALLDRDGAVDAVRVEASGLGAAAAIALRCDVSGESEVVAALDACTDQLGTPTALVANAGIEINGSAHTLALADWHRVIEVNLTGTFLTCRHVIRRMLESGQPGSIVCTTSPSAFVGFAGGGNGAYGASKGGISALVRSLAIDYAGAGIRVNAVVPGATDTPLLLAGVPAGTRASAHHDARRELDRQAAEQIPLRRLADPREIANAIVWLLSDEASYVTGTHLVCDGGLLAKSANTF
jgi:NAD(P)-dependent dehydrogenase (short-subunit alcohol dehydrogenase family)